MRRIFLLVCTALIFDLPGAAQEPSEIGGETGFQVELVIGPDTPDGVAPVMRLITADPGLPTEPQALVQVPRVIDDLQLIDSQLAEIRERSEQTIQKYQKRREDLTRRFGEAGQQSPEFTAEMKKINEAQKKALVEIVESVLLPLQRERLKQISAQAKLNARDANVFDAFAAELDLSESQKKQLADSAKDFEKELREEIRELRQKRQRERLESILTDAQEKKLDELLGDDLPRSAEKDPDK